MNRTRRYGGVVIASASKADSHWEPRFESWWRRFSFFPPLRCLLAFVSITETHRTRKKGRVPLFRCFFVKKRRLFQSRPISRYKSCSTPQAISIDGHIFSLKFSAEALSEVFLKTFSVLTVIFRIMAKNPMLRYEISIWLSQLSCTRNHEIRLDGGGILTG